MFGFKKKVIYLGLILVTSSIGRAKPTCEPTDFERVQKTFSEIAAQEEKELEPSPFQQACKDKYALYKRPISGLFKTDLNITDKYGKESVEFMRDLSSSVLRYANENLASVEAMEKCMTTNKLDSSCQGILKTLHADLPKYIAESRYQLSMAIDPIWSTSSGVANVNSKLKNMHSYKEFDWEPLNPDEKAVAQKDLAEYFTQASAMTDQKLPKAERIEKTLLKVKITRSRHMTAYQMMLSEFPLMNYITKLHPSDEDLLSAIRTMKARATKELVKLLRAQAQLDKEVTADSLIFLKYKSIVEGLLVQKPKFCGMGVYMIETSSNRTTLKAIAIGLPLMAASMAAPFIIPGALGVMTSMGIGAASGLGYAWADQMNLEQAKQRNLSRAQGSLNLADASERISQVQSLIASKPKTDAEKIAQIKNKELAKAILSDNEDMETIASSRNLNAVMIPLVFVAPSNGMIAISKFKQMKSLAIKVSSKLKVAE